MQYERQMENFLLNLKENILLCYGHIICISSVFTNPVIVFHLTKFSFQFSFNGTERLQNQFPQF